MRLSAARDARMADLVKLRRRAGRTGQCQLPAEAVWKRIFLLFSLSNQEMSDEALH